MGVRLALVDMDQMFHNSKNRPIIVNDFDIESQEQKDQLNNTIYTSYSEDSLEVIPSCDCGHLTGSYNEGVECGHCGTKCLPITERPLESVLWIRTPKGVDSLIHPQVWMMLSKTFTVNGVNVLEWLANPKYFIQPEKEPDTITKLKHLKVKRGFNNLLRNFDAIMTLLIDDRVFKIPKPEDRVKLKEFITNNRKFFFPSHLPIPSKMMFITESSAMGTYQDPTVLPAVDAIRTISGIEHSITPLNQTTIETRTFQAVHKLTSYYETFYSTALGIKEGWFRKHVYGTRSHFSFRAVVSSITEPHEYDEIHIAWGVAVMFLKVHLINKLYARGFSPNEAVKHIYEHTLKYDVLLDEIFQELINESEFEGKRGLFIVLQRNPSLTRGSAQALRVTRVKPDPADNTTSLSVLILASLNCDFDGKGIAV